MPHVPSMTYVRVEWRHSFPAEPVTIYSELDEHRWEVRKVEVFPDGSFGYASKRAETPSTGLGLVPFPPPAEIADDPAFDPVEITADEFEKMWRIALDTLQLSSVGKPGPDDREP